MSSIFRFKKIIFYRFNYKYNINKKGLILIKSYYDIFLTIKLKYKFKFIFDFNLIRHQ